MGGGTYLVGERGPELFTPGTSGNITPNGGFGGGGNVTINVNGGDPQQVVDALRRYQQLNGSVPIRVS
jgi:phage-related minor tail protein